VFLRDIRGRLGIFLELSLHQLFRATVETATAARTPRLRSEALQHRLRSFASLSTCATVASTSVWFTGLFSSSATLERSSPTLSSNEKEPGRALISERPARG